MRILAAILFVSFLFPAFASAELNVPILLYHRFGPQVADSMTITTPVFASHLRFLKENGYTVIPLRQLIDAKRGIDKRPLPRKPVVIVEDDAHISVYTEMLPLIRQYRIPVTLFTYPSAISNAKYAMTWEQLRELKATGLFDIQSHTFWHPNFKRDKKKMTAAEYEQSVTIQLQKSKARLEKELGGTVDLLAWPFGLYDDDLLRRASAAGYLATFSIERRPVTDRDELMKLPRFLMTDADRGPRFEALVRNAAGQ